VDRKQQVQQYVRVSRFGPPCSVEQIQQAERKLGLPLPPVLQELYLAFDGFYGPAGLPLLWPLLGRNGLVGINLFYRHEPDAPSWIHEVVFFGSDGIGGTAGAAWGIDLVRPSEVIEWGVGDGEDHAVVASSVFEIWARRQQEYDEGT
jgi:hypothetical protein